MRAGDLRHRVTFQSRVTTRGPDGEPLVSWADFRTVWAAIEPVSGKEYVAAQEQQSPTDTRITVRIQSGLTSTMRAIHVATGDIYNIQAILPDETLRKYITLLAQKGLNDGQ